jgi:chaperonin GroEL (HSP60 family)
MVAEPFREHTDPHFRCNAYTRDDKDLVQARVIDPAKGTRTAIPGRAPIASPMLTTEALIGSERDSDATDELLCPTPHSLWPPSLPREFAHHRPRRR